MQDFTEEKLVVDFIPMKIKKKNISYSFLALLFPLFGCNDSQQVTENIPRGLINAFIDLNLASYQHLNNVGTHAYIEGGVKGVLIIHDYDDQWYAFERTCAYNPTKKCSHIWVDSINIQLMCGQFSNSTTFNECCESKYTYSGFPIKGPSQGRLAQYYISKTGNILQVYN